MFVYGATGAGKTHTMLGSVENPGIIFRTVMELYSRIDSVKEESDIEVVISYLEIYNETVIDLINPSTRLDIREDGKGVNIPGLSRHRPSGPDDLLRFVFNIRFVQQTIKPTKRISKRPMFYCIICVEMSI